MTELLSTTPTETFEQNPTIGFLAVAIAVLFFGSQWIVVKKFPSGDGFYLQWMMCIGILVVGIFTMLIRSVTNPGPIYLEPFAMIGGALWTTGNLLCTPTLHLIGLSLGPALWGVANMVTGWITGTFGLFGLQSDKDNVSIFWLNCLGCLFAALSVPLYALITTKNTQDERKEKETHLNMKLIDNEVDNIQMIKDHIQHEEESPIFVFINSLPKSVQRITGLVFSIIAGMLFGSAFDPSKYLQDNHLSSPNGIDYVLAHFLGIFLSSTFYFIIYSICFRNKPFIFKEASLPGIVSGMVWGIAQVSWFIANTNLPYIVSYPIICAGPGLISQLWGMIVFREVKGMKNFIFFGIGTFVLVVGIICIVISKS